ncbi:MAG: calcium-binding protein [Planctomycetota bacterium]
MSRLRSGVLVPALVLGSTAWAQVTQRVSLSTAGLQGNHGSVGARLSVDGRFVAFQSKATNFIPGLVGNHIYVRDRVNGTTEYVSQNTNGVPGNGGSYSPRISADGRFVTFESAASNLAPTDASGSNTDIFLRDRQLSTTEQISVDSNEVGGEGSCSGGSISADGRWVVFSSFADNLVPADTNDTFDIFLRDRQLGTTVRVSVSSTGEEANAQCRRPYLSDDGRFVAFYSSASNLVPGDTNGTFDIFVRDMQLGTTERASVDSNGVEANLESGYWGLGFSADGRHVAFTSTATNLVPGDTNAAVDVFVRDLQTDTTERVSIGGGGVEGDYYSSAAQISGDGRYVAFASYATNLVPGALIGANVYLRDRLSGTTELVTVPLGVPPPGWDCTTSTITRDGRFVGITSGYGNLVYGDWNGHDDVFVVDRFGGTNFESLCDPGAGGVIPCPCGNPPSGPGRGCDNSSSTGGAVLSASGGTYLSSDSLVFTTSGQRPTALSIVSQWTGGGLSGIAFGMGVRCTSGTFKRLYAKSASGGRITAPDFVAGDQPVSVRSAALGDTIQVAQSRWYFVFYRDNVALGGCPPTSNFNNTQTGRVLWSP